jgi:hypothetical protein
MPRKTFVDGQTLPASDLNNFLMNQSVMTFSNAAARTAAITTPLEGMITYLEDTDLISVYESGSWRTSLSPRGGVLQVITGLTSTQVTNSTTSYATTGLTASITPKSSSSRILVMVNQNGIYKAAGLGGNGTNLKLQKDSVDVSTIGLSLGYTGSAIENLVAASQIYVDTPGSLSAITYRTVFANRTTAASVSVQQSSETSTITLMEIAS